MPTPAVQTRVPSRRAELRLLAGFAAIPPSVAVLTFVGYLALYYTWQDIGGIRPADPVASAGSLGLAVAMVALLVTVCGAVPGVSWLMRRGPLTLQPLLALGAALGNIPFAIIVVSASVARLAGGATAADVSSLWYGARGAVLRVALGSVVGAASAVVFWLVGVRGTTPSD